MTLVAIVILIATASVDAQINADLEWAAQQIEVSNTASRESRRDLATKLLDRLGSTPSPGMDQRQLVQFLKLQQSYLAVDPDRLSTSIKDVVEAPSAEQRHLALVEARYDLLQRAGNYAQVLTPNNVTSVDAAKLLSALKVASQAVDDIKDPSVFGGKASGITLLLNRASGLSDFATAIKDPDAKKVVSSFNSTIGAITGKIGRLGVSMPNPLKAFDLALGVSGSYVQVAREGMIECTDALILVGDAINNDPNAEKRLQDLAPKINRTFSLANWGKAMAESMLDSLVGRIPFVRSLAKWTMPKATGIPDIGRFLTMHVDCPGTDLAKVEISQVEDKVRAVIAQGVIGCLNKGELLFEGDYIGDTDVSRTNI